MIEEVSVSYQKYSSFEDIRDKQEEWDNFVLSVKGDIYLSFEWCKIWWRYYGKGRKLEIFMYYAEDELIGIMPIFIENVCLPPICLRCAKIVGSDFTISIVNPPVKPTYAEIIFRSLIEDILSKAGCDLLWIGPVPDFASAIPALRTLQKLASISKINIYEKTKTNCTIFNLPDSFDQYLASLEKRQRVNYRRDNNLFQKHFKITTNVIEHGDYFEDFVLLHEIQWQNEGKMGHFKDWPLGYEFNLSLAHAHAKIGRYRQVRLHADDNIVADQLCYIFGDTLYWRLPARQIGPDWDRFGLGRLSLIKLIEWSIGNGIKAIEAGPGHYEYKVKSGGVEYDLKTFYISRDSLFSRMKLKVFFLLSRVLIYVYYQKWFLTIAPKLPLKRKSLWKLWIKTHL